MEMKFLSIILTIVFLIMQLNGAINWPWYAIISPILILLVFKIVIWILILIIGLIAFLLMKN